MTMEGPVSAQAAAALAGERQPVDAAPAGATPSRVEPSEPRPLSLRAQLMIWFGISYGIILITIIAGLVVIDGGRVFQPSYVHYDWIINLVGIASLSAFAGGLGAAYVILGAALRPLRQITEAARDVAPERIDESRINMPEVGTEVNEARRELNSALDRIEAGYQAQERFISNVSHELKTPIAIVQNEAQRLRRMKRPREELEQFVNDTANQMGRLGKMVESFLTLARIDYEERMQKNEEYWFQDLLVEATSRSRAQALTHGVSIELELPEDLEQFDDPSWGDPELVSSAVENLIRNAIRFSPRESAVHVSLSVPETVEPPPEVVKEKSIGRGWNRKAVPEPEVERLPTRYVKIQVRDEGPGMPEDLIATVFEPFQQAASERHSNRGTGLGLAIAHKVCTLHKGSIRAFNRTDGRSGCVIEIRLPFLEEVDWKADRPITAALTEGGIGEGIRDSRLE
ncbi:putative sensor histidine kinase TcrY [Planctomycetes bacterium Poly30]|uniref:histidine kinase n=1 Tax=Saltatorellus ferox TaxID=2528018 RepID=A0A518F0P0_9BACT|nr:putative sensor histidine kinase TcrY [Planctomycetes bacterium Poly30]